MKVNTINVNIANESIAMSTRKLKDAVQASIVHPRYRSVKNKEGVLNNLTYHCNDNSCDFSIALKIAKESAEVQAKGLGEISDIVIRELENIPTAKTTAAFIIQSDGHSLICIKNKDFSSPKDDDSVGLIDITEVRRRVISEAMIQRAQQQQQIQSSLIGGLIGTAVGATSIVTLLKLFKRI